MPFEDDPTHHTGITVEIERCSGCDQHQYCSNHIESKYADYAEKLESAIRAKCPDSNALICHVNPGPKTLGMEVKQSQYQTCLYSSMVRNHVSGRYLPDVCFRYPRIGALEVSVMRGGLRKNSTRFVVFSKLKGKKWPNCEFVAAKVAEHVESKLKGWTLIDTPSPKHQKYATADITDEELRAKVISKGQSLLSAFRGFDKDGDGVVNKVEFATGLTYCGIDLPRNQVKRLWEICDEDKSGTITVREFGRKFSQWKSSHQGHKPGGARETPRAVDTTTKYGVSGDQLDTNKEILKKSITQMSRDPAIVNMALEESTPDIVRAKICARHGGLANGFSQFDANGDGVVTAEEFERHLPAVLGVQTVPEKLLEDIFDAYDGDMSGEIDLKEFLADKPYNSQGVLLGKFAGGRQATTVMRDERPEEPF